MIGREWLTTLKLEVVPKRRQKGKLYVNSIEKGEGEKQSEETKMYVHEFSELFTQKRKKVRNYE